MNRIECRFWIVLNEVDWEKTLSKWIRKDVENGDGTHREPGPVSTHRPERLQRTSKSASLYRTTRRRLLCIESQSDNASKDTRRSPSKTCWRLSWDHRERAFLCKKERTTDNEDMKSCAWRKGASKLEVPFPCSRQKQKWSQPVIINLTLPLHVSMLNAASLHKKSWLTMISHNITLSHNKKKHGTICRHMMKCGKVNVPEM